MWICLESQVSFFFLLSYFTNILFRYNYVVTNTNIMAPHLHKNYFVFPDIIADVRYMAVTKL